MSKYGPTTKLIILCRSPKTERNNKKLYKGKVTVNKKKKKKKIYGAAWLSHGVVWLRHGAALLSYGAAWLNWCGVAQLCCGVAQLRCGVAQLVACWLAGRQARVRFSAQHHREVCPTELTSDEEMERGLGECIV
jgi:hypothetical protein